MTEATPAVEATETAPHPWADLPAERLTLLRLAPLQTTASEGPRPLRFVEFGQVERHAETESLLRLSIRIPGNPGIRGHDLLELWIDHRTRSVRFGLERGLQLSLPNRGLARFLLGQAAGWAQQRWPHYRVEPCPLAVLPLQGQARQRRDHCLLAQGFELEVPTEANQPPFCQARSVAALLAGWNKEKVQMISQQDAALMLEQANQQLLEQDAQIRRQQERVTRFQQQDGTLRFTILCLIAFALFQAGLLIWIATR
ncbi:hypothetical protein [Stutzerimonas tarimensis]|uniref:Uncharacterized protein n=1 Tax=Stutzerimonas tarimensis TaxID=1507735 RepID=A0ABV7TDT7_9GAMM